MKFTQSVKPATPEQALAYAKQPNTIVLGGGMWVRMQKKQFDTAIDLSALGLDTIEETADGLKIGAYVTLRQLETSPAFAAYTKDAVKTSFSPIVGVQFRNGATVGGSIFGRFGFSDVTTLFMALGATLTFVEAGEMPIASYVGGGILHDVLTYITLPKTAPDAVAVFAHRHSATDFPFVTVAAAKRGEQITVCASPVPVRPCAKTFACKDASADAFFADMPVKPNATQTAVYRDHVTRVLINRAILAVGGAPHEN